MKKHEWICKEDGTVFSTRKSMYEYRNKMGYNHHKVGRGGWKCPICHQIFMSRSQLRKHVIEKGHQNYQNAYTKAKELGLPKPTISDDTRHKLGNGQRGISRSDEIKEKISKSMKKAHAEGRAYNIGKRHWFSLPSYPEEWFIKMMKKEFNLELGKDYVREYNFYKFRLDFAWPERKICVEIDGEQHHRDVAQQRRDKEKDALLKQDGWSELRKDWIDIFNNPKLFISEVKKFIGVNI